MICPYCRKENSDTDEICSGCKANLKEIRESNETVVQNEINEALIVRDIDQEVKEKKIINEQNLQNNNKSSKNIILIMFGILVVIVVIVLGIFYLINSSSNLKSNNRENDKTEIDNKNDESDGIINDYDDEYTVGKVQNGTNLEYNEKGAFLMEVESVISSSDGISTVGKILRGTVKVGDEVQVVGYDGNLQTFIVNRIQRFNVEAENASYNDAAILMFKNANENDILAGEVLAKPNSIVATTKFDARIRVLTSEEGGRYTPFFNGYRPQFYFWGVDNTGVVTLPDGITQVNPGDTGVFTVELYNYIAMEVGTEFKVREGGRVVATGVVTKIY